jgi:replication-associated recombination protein RarA
MIIWNQEALSNLKIYVDNLIWGKSQSVPFFIVSGSKNIGKTTAIQALIKEILGQYFFQDFLFVRDVSADYVWDLNKFKKEHSLKIELPKRKEEQFLELQDASIYKDIWIREINLWLQQSSVGPLKVVLLENIERMTVAAANAFLKTCEEPLAWRIIFATTSNQSKLLDTILSRAVLIKFNELTTQQMLDFVAEKNYFSEDASMAHFVVHMAMGRPGVLVKFHEMFSQNESLKSDFVKLVELLREWKSLFYTQELLKSFYTHGYLEFFIDGWIAYCMDNHLSAQAQRWLKVKRLMQTNVSVENLLLYGVLD